MDVALPPLCHRSGPDLSTSFVGSLGDAPRRSSLPPLLPRREPPEPAALQTSSASRETPPRAVDAHVNGATTTPSAPAAAKDITPWRFVGMVGNTLLSSPIPSRKGADPHRDDLIRMPDRGRRPITRSDQETMGLPDDLLVPSPQVRPVIEHLFPTSGGGDAPEWRRPRSLGVGGMSAGSPSSAPRRRGHGSARPRCRRSCWHLRHVTWWLQFVSTSATKRGPHSADPFGTYVFLVAGTGFEPVTSGL